MSEIMLEVEKVKFAMIKQNRKKGMKKGNIKIHVYVDLRPMINNKHA